MLKFVYDISFKWVVRFHSFRSEDNRFETFCSSFRPTCRSIVAASPWSPWPSFCPSSLTSGPSGITTPVSVSTSSWWPTRSYPSSWPRSGTSYKAQKKKCADSPHSRRRRRQFVFIWCILLLFYFNRRADRRTFCWMWKGRKRERDIWVTLLLAVDVNVNVGISALDFSFVQMLNLRHNFEWKNEKWESTSPSSASSSSAVSFLYL